MAADTSEAGSATPAYSLPPGRLFALAALWILGILIHAFLPAEGWLLLGSGFLLLAGWIWARRSLSQLPARVVPGLAAGCIVLASATWTSVTVRQLPAHHVKQYLTQQSSLAQVVGTVLNAPEPAPAQRGAFAEHFSWEHPGCTFDLQLQSLTVGQRHQTATGLLRINMQQPEHRLQVGDRIEAYGWIHDFHQPENPGEWDYARYMHEQGYDGGLAVPSRDNWRLLSHAQGLARLAVWRQTLIGVLTDSLELGLPRRGEQAPLLALLLLGINRGDVHQVSDAFRKVGMMHLLSISGAHLAMLLGLVWLVLRMTPLSPGRAIGILTVVLALYVLVLPPQIAILRSGIMAGIFCLARITGRRLHALDVVAAAAVVCLIWRPMDVYLAGFQLSFGLVAVMAQFTRPLSLALWPEPMVQPVVVPWHLHAARLSADFLAANLAAFAWSIPVVLYHFQTFSPWNIVVNVLATPLVTLVLGLGYLKMVVGAALPSVSLLLAGPLSWLTQTLMSLVEHAADWPGSQWVIPQQPGVAWTLAAVGWCTLWLAGWFAGRSKALFAGIAVLVAWVLFLPANPAVEQGALPVLRVHTLAVGDGSCHILRIREQPRSTREHVVMYDCGSQARLDIGSRVVVPALRALGISAIDTLVISHADMDHFCGSLDVMDQIAVHRVLTTPQVLGQARDNPASASAMLVREIQARGVPLETTSRGKSETWGQAAVEVLWPPADLQAERTNSTSMVLRVSLPSTPQRRLLLTGDAEMVVMQGILPDGEALRANVMELPHHGSFVDLSPRLLDAVSPSLVLQSSGPGRLQNDKWAAHFNRRPHITRLITQRQGALEVQWNEQGELRWRTFREPAWRLQATSPAAAE